jgi:hypothetical protein
MERMKKKMTKMREPRTMMNDTAVIITLSFILTAYLYLYLSCSVTNVRPLYIGLSILPQYCVTISQEIFILVQFLYFV